VNVVNVILDLIPIGKLRSFVRFVVHEKLKKKAKMVNLTIFLRLLALVLFFLASIGVNTGKINAIAAGLFCWLLSASI